LGELTVYLIKVPNLRIMENTEIEIQVKIENSQPLLEFLEKKGEFKSEKHQIDEYFSPAHRDFVAVRPAKEWLRLRNADNIYSINYKNWYFNEQGESHHCDEYESKIENLGKVKKIFQALNFKSLVVVDKIRKIWMYNNYEVSLDSVKGLGDFVEIEYLGKEEKVDPEKITRGMIDFLKSVGCGKIERNYVGYPFLLLFPEEAGWKTQ